jgi:hypothetical protein
LPKTTGITAGNEQKINDLIRLFNETEVQDAEELRQRVSAARERIFERMLDEGASYGVASGAPSFYNQDEKSFVKFMQSVRQSLDWQCDMVTSSFQRYLEIGDVPPPGFPMRIAILLRKAGEVERERRFLAAWCRHFRSGSGKTYAALIERAEKVGAI